MRLVFCKGWREQGLFLHHHSLHPTHTVLTGEQGWGTLALGEASGPSPSPGWGAVGEHWWSGWASTPSPQPPRMGFAPGLFCMTQCNPRDWDRFYPPCSFLPAAGSLSGCAAAACNTRSSALNPVCLLRLQQWLDMGKAALSLQCFRIPSPSGSVHPRSCISSCSQHPNPAMQ